MSDQTHPAHPIVMDGSSWAYVVTVLDWPNSSGLLQITVGRNIEQFGSIRKAIVVINCSVVMNSKTEQINHSLAGTTRRTGLFSGYVHIIITSTLVTYF